MILLYCPFERKRKEKTKASELGNIRNDG